MSVRYELLAIVFAIGAGQAGQAGCDATSTSSATRGVHAEFGVFFGGQVQQRQRIPRETDRTRQTLGFRLTFPRAMSESQRVEWQLDVPGAGKSAPDHRGRLGEGRITRLGHAQTRGGEVQFEQVIELRPADPLGTWNIRVLVDGQIVLDRPFLLVAPDR